MVAVVAGALLVAALAKRGAPDDLVTAGDSVRLRSSGDVAAAKFRAAGPGLLTSIPSLRPLDVRAAPPVQQPHAPNAVAGFFVATGEGLMKFGRETAEGLNLGWVVDALLVAFPDGIPPTQFGWSLEIIGPGRVSPENPLLKRISPEDVARLRAEGRLS